MAINLLIILSTSYLFQQLDEGSFEGSQALSCDVLWMGGSSIIAHLE